MLCQFYYLPKIICHLFLFPIDSISLSNPPDFLLYNKNGPETITPPKHNNDYFVLHFMQICVVQLFIALMAVKLQFSMGVNRAPFLKPKGNFSFDKWKHNLQTQTSFVNFTQFATKFVVIFLYCAYLFDKKCHKSLKYPIL